MRAETWHPCGYGLSPVVYVQRLGDEPTGMFFVVPRWKYWAIAVLISAARMPVIGRGARLILKHVSVTYRWISNEQRGQA